jgi:hypothetical protein
LASDPDGTSGGPPGGAIGGGVESSGMSDDTTAPADGITTPENTHGRAPRLLTLTEAASATGMSRKAIERRVDRGTLRAVHDDRGRRVIPRGELERADLLGEGAPAVGASREVVVWREMYERERTAHETTREELMAKADTERAELTAQVAAAAAEAKSLAIELAAIANAGPIRAWRLRRTQRDKSTAVAGDETPPGSSSSS